MLFQGQQVPRRPARGLMWLTLARLGERLLRYDDRRVIAPDEQGEQGDGNAN
jgi:hypothetical protein